MEIRGLSGDLRWGYRVVAVYGPWTLRTVGATAELSAHLVQIDHVGCAQRPLWAHLRIGRRAVRYIVDTCTVHEDELQATLTREPGEEGEHGCRHAADDPVHVE